MNHLPFVKFCLRHLATVYLLHGSLAPFVTWISVFGVSEQVRHTPACSAPETTYTGFAIRQLSHSNFQRANNKITEQTARTYKSDLRFCCSYAISQVFSCRGPDCIVQLMSANCKKIIFLFFFASFTFRH